MLINSSLKASLYTKKALLTDLIIRHLFLVWMCLKTVGIIYWGPLKYFYLFLKHQCFTLFFTN